MRHVVWRDGAYLGGQQGDDGDGPAGERHELDFVRFTFSVRINYRTNVTGQQPFAGHIFQEHYLLVFVNHGFLPTHTR